MDIEASAGKHGVPDDDMIHPPRHHWRAFETDDEDGAAVIYTMPARRSS